VKEVLFLNYSDSFAGSRIGNIKKLYEGQSLGGRKNLSSPTRLNTDIYIFVFNIHSYTRYTLKIKMKKMDKTNQTKLVIFQFYRAFCPHRACHVMFV